MARPVLMALPRSPFDPSSEVSSWLRHAGERLADEGHSVRCLGVAATARDGPTDLAWLRDHGGVARVTYHVEREGPTHRHVVGMFDFTHRGVVYRLLDTGDRSAPMDPDPSRREVAWDREGAALGETYDATLHRAIADAGAGGVLLTFGSSPAWARRRALARDAGHRVVYALAGDEAPDGLGAVGEVDAVVSVGSGVEKRGGWSAWVGGL